MKFQHTCRIYGQRRTNPVRFIRAVLRMNFTHAFQRDECCQDFVFAADSHTSAAPSATLSDWVRIDFPVLIALTLELEHLASWQLRIIRRICKA